MGMFDSVYASCPRCDESVEFQSKAGECRLSGYSPNSVPIVIALDLHNSSKTCPKCNKEVTLCMLQHISNVPMVVS